MSEPRKPVLVYLTERERAALEAVAAAEERSLSQTGRRILLADPQVQARLG